MALLGKCSSKSIGSTARPAARPARVSGRLARPTAPQRRAAAVSVRAGLFDFLAPKGGAGGAPVPPKAKQLAAELTALVSGRGGAPPAREDVEALVAQLAPLSVKNPLRSPLLWGEWRVLWASKPSAVGGPLKKGAGPVLAPGQVAKQTLEPPGTLVNTVTFKTLGFLPGYSRQFGQIQPVSGDTFVLRIAEGEVSTGLGGPQKKAFDIERRIQIVYLDDALRVARFLPTEGLADSEQAAAGEQQEGDEILFVFAREGVEEEEEEEAAGGDDEEDEEEEQERAASPLGGLFGGTRRVQSLATQVERTVEAQRTVKGGRGTQPVKAAAGGGGTVTLGGRRQQPQQQQQPAQRQQQQQQTARERERAEAAARKQKELEERRAAQEKAKAEAAAAREREQAQLQREREAAAKAKAAAEEKARQEREREARAERQAAIKELLADLGDELKERQAAAREAANDARAVARDSQQTLKQVAAAEAAVAEAERDAAKVAAALDEAGLARKQAEQLVQEARQAVRDAEAAYAKVGR